MKKINILFTFIFSLFFFSTQVIAIEKKNMIFNLEDSDFSYINNEFFELRTKTKEFLKNNDSSQYYIIGYNSDKSKLVVDIFSGEINTKYIEEVGSYLRFLIDCSYSEYYLENNELKLLTISSRFTKYLGTVNSSSYQNFIDTNIDDIFLTNTTSVYWNINVNARDYNFSFGVDKDTPTLYDIYLAAKIGEPFDPHEDEKDLLLNFYNLVIEKIIYITSIFTSNYIFLSILVIIIFVIAIEFFWRLL